MYINPFWAGVIATVLAELLTMFVFGLFAKDKEEENGKDQTV